MFLFYYYTWGELQLYIIISLFYTHYFYNIKLAADINYYIII